MVIACMMMVKGVCLLHKKYARLQHVYGTGLNGAHSLSLRKCLSAHHQSAITEAERRRGYTCYEVQLLLKSTRCMAHGEEHCYTAHMKARALMGLQFQ